MRISESIVSDFRQGDIESFYVAVYPSLLRYAERALGEQHAYLAEDCVQEAIFRVYNARTQFDKPAHLKAYLFSCVHNEIVTIFRKSERHDRYLETRSLVADDFVDQFVLQETLDRIYTAVDALPEHLRRIFDLSFGEGLKNVEIAELLQISPNTLKKQKARLIRTLREQLDDDPSIALVLAFLMAGGVA